MIDEWKNLDFFFYNMRILLYITSYIYICSKFNLSPKMSSLNIKHKHTTVCVFNLNWFAGYPFQHETA